MKKNVCLVHSHVFRQSERKIRTFFVIIACGYTKKYKTFVLNLLTRGVFALYLCRDHISKESLRTELKNTIINET